MFRSRMKVLFVIVALWPASASAETATLVCPYGGRFGGGWTIILDLPTSMIRTAHLDGKLIYGNGPFTTSDNELRWTAFSTDHKPFQESLTRDTLELTSNHNHCPYPAKFSIPCDLYTTQLWF